MLQDNFEFQLILMTKKERRGRGSESGNQYVAYGEFFLIE
jgi:hypothetical protein